MFKSLSLQVNPVLELQTALLDGSAACGLEDAPDTSEIAGPVDAIVLEEAFKACATALSSGGVLPKTNMKVVKWLHSQGVVEKVENDELVLSRESVNHGISVSRPVLEKCLRTVSSTLELQEELKSKGWRFVDELGSAHVRGRRMTRDNPKSYYSLLLHFADSLEYYEEENLFHHRQGDKYYSTVEMAVVQHPDELVDIPSYKPAPFYAQLQKYLCGETSVDPREEDTEKRARTRVWLGSV